MAWCSEGTQTLTFMLRLPSTQEEKGKLVSAIKNEALRSIDFRRHAEIKRYNILTVLSMKDLAPRSSKLLLAQDRGYRK